MKIIEPATGQLLCRPVEKEAVTRSGFFIPDKAVEVPLIATVVRAPKEALYKKGDEIIYKSYTTNDIKLDDVDYFLVHQDDVLGKVVEVAKL